MTAPAPIVSRQGAVAAAIAAGFLATLVFTLLMHYGAPLLTGFPMDVTELLTAFFGDNAVLGTMAHYVTGSIAYPVAYLLVRPYLPASPIVRGLLCGAVLWLAANLLLLPIIGAGVFMSHLFQGNEAVMPEAASLIGHVAFGLVLANLVEWALSERGGT
ncbi:MAG: hypothetical protein HYR63_03790 [Proteobacteria bacterium]|nr:hypothetical protein [Pseudomonadota bacterium]MBI3498581.1 hypothetical protein [Pseudomonadota bacterium]